MMQLLQVAFNTNKIVSARGLSDVLANLKIADKYIKKYLAFVLKYFFSMTKVDNMSVGSKIFDFLTNISNI
jgi:hypothetical protein